MFAHMTVHSHRPGQNVFFFKYLSTSSKMQGQLRITFYVLMLSGKKYLVIDYKMIIKWNAQSCADWPGLTQNCEQFSGGHFSSCLSLKSKNVTKNHLCSLQLRDIYYLFQCWLESNSNMDSWIIYVIFPPVCDSLKCAAAVAESLCSDITAVAG